MGPKKGAPNGRNVAVYVRGCSTRPGKDEPARASPRPGRPVLPDLDRVESQPIVFIDVFPSRLTLRQERQRSTRVGPARPDSWPAAAEKGLIQTPIVRRVCV
jgi:hypothetical protein